MRTTTAIMLGTRPWIHLPAKEVKAIGDAAQDNLDRMRADDRLSDLEKVVLELAFREPIQAAKMEIILRN